MIWSRHPFFRKEMLQKFASFLNLAKKCKIIAVCGMERVLNISKQNNALHSFCANLQEEQLCMSKQKLQFLLCSSPFKDLQQCIYMPSFLHIWAEQCTALHSAQYIERAFSSSLFLNCNVLCSSPLQGLIAMYLYAKLFAHLSRIVHCTSFCAIQKEHSAAVYLNCNILCSSPFQGITAMHLYAKLFAYLGRIVHCTSFCAIYRKSIQQQSI